MRRPESYKIDDFTVSDGRDQPSWGESMEIAMLGKTARPGSHQCLQDYRPETHHFLGNQVRMHAGPRK
jgi:hypothetical protein